MLKISDYLLNLRDLIVKEKYEGYGRQQNQSNFIDTQSPQDMYMDDFIIKDQGVRDKVSRNKISDGLVDFSRQGDRAGKV